MKNCLACSTRHRISVYHSGPLPLGGVARRLATDTTLPQDIDGRPLGVLLVEPVVAMT
jgi:hypothetical protein